MLSWGESGEEAVGIPCIVSASLLYLSVIISKLKNISEDEKDVGNPQVEGKSVSTLSSSFKAQLSIWSFCLILDSLGGRWKALDIIGPGLFSLPGKAVGDRTDIFIEPRYAGL